MNNSILEEKRIKKRFETLERNVLILIAIPIPFFAVVYLNSQNSTFSFDLPELSTFWDSFGLGLVVSILFLQYFNFQTSIKRILRGNLDLETKLALYSQATMQRFWILFVSTFISALGLLFFDNPGFTMAFAVTLLFFSLGKPSPDRIVKSLKLKGEEKDKVLGMKRRG
ncbi:hypothetical protein [Aquiflexum balticum]|uniref:hypothetical protein n=1 Tax=Aquiflexum balticum TaxID=280473 RepID=UPI001E3D3576|nr:hypothetical protein [Aquiflexum balticum]